MVAIVPQTVPEPAVRSRQGNGTFTLGTRSAATETRTITYNATQGVRISRDPLKNAEMLEGANLYSYVRNNSIDSVDLNGLGQWNFGAVNNPGSVDNGDPLVTYTMDSTQRQCCKEATIYRFIPFGPDMTDQADNPDPTAVNWEPDDYDNAGNTGGQTVNGVAESAGDEPTGRGNAFFKLPSNSFFKFVVRCTKSSGNCSVSGLML